MSKSTKVSLIVIAVLIIDQALKIWVKTGMEYGDEIKILGLDWARLHFVENPGMAFGWKLGGEYGKLILSIFRIGAVGFLVYLISKLLKSKASTGLLVSFALILAGALGNIIDSTIYGLIFSESKFHGGLAMMFPPEGGYAPLLHGRVVDMFYFPMFKGYFPDWFPFWSNEPFLFFKPVFNVADSAITIGVLNLILFHRSFFNNDELGKNMGAEADENKSSEITEASPEKVADAPESKKPELENPVEKGKETM